ncbi:MotA/TolQ/ExbB proton channel family protein [Bacteriovorax sp. DB6_IX]|uniref:MotA/TolQ/ExbB proton channel family protein n=1 Tax=Bacteriovorax sp. DB6_IX TaxID=1353530 RepID=UPI00038A2216|nr:MotA/TolQ/ExbB proton channel family protein [Bacteriovorax sp. DB6_IX]EQC52777.1 transporter, MotA/TolQ/ExbB proton channel family protein [Bacteriovorax sp. DB6_IX]
MLDKKDLTIFTQAFISSTVFIGLMNIVYFSIQGKGFTIFERLLLLAGGDFLSGGYIQWSTYFAFVWALLDIRSLKKRVVAETSYFKANLLPKSEKHMIMANDVYDIHQKIREFEKKHAKTLLTQLIKNACAKFRSTKSISEVLDVINIMTDLHRDSSEMEQTNIRYLLWAIPSLGFIGTVLGISQALMIANGKDMKAITATLGVAFDTTLVALILSIILMWLFHDLQKVTDGFHVKSKEYVIENFINKIEI